MLGWLCYHYYNKQEVLQPQTPVMQIHLDSIEMVKKQAKIRRLEFWYDKMLLAAYVHKRNGEEIMAKEAFFHAKTIFPERIEPRINLVRSFSSLCYEKGFYCYDAQREIDYAHRYIDSTDTPMVYELDSLFALIKDVDYNLETEFIQ